MEHVDALDIGICIVAYTRGICMFMGIVMGFTCGEKGMEQKMETSHP